MNPERVAYWEKVHKERCEYFWDGDKKSHCKRKECWFKNCILEELGKSVLQLSFAEKLIN